MINKSDTKESIKLQGESQQNAERQQNDKIRLNRRRRGLDSSQMKQQIYDIRSSTLNFTKKETIYSPATDGQIMTNRRTTQNQNQQQIQQQINHIQQGLSLQKNQLSIQDSNTNEQIYSNESQEVEPEQLQEQKQGQMCYGDIITLVTKHKFTGNEIPFHGIISAEGISFASVQCISQKNPNQPNSAVHTFRTCLFRVECHAKPQHQKAEMERKLGQQIRYGQLIKLKHLHSQGFINIENQVAKEHGCLRTFISLEGFSFQVLNGNNLKTIDQVISYSDQILLSCKINKNQYYLHCNSKAL